MRLKRRAETGSRANRGQGHATHASNHSPDSLVPTLCSPAETYEIHAKKYGFFRLLLLQALLFQQTKCN